jgi:hypothetical protein
MYDLTNRQGTDRLLSLSSDSITGPMFQHVTVKTMCLTNTRVLSLSAALLITIDRKLSRHAMSNYLNVLYALLYWKTKCILLFLFQFLIVTSHVIQSPPKVLGHFWLFWFCSPLFCAQ